jgi:capsular polysaccharide biosynthesis protein
MKNRIKKLFFLIKFLIKKLIPSLITPIHTISIQEATLNSYASVHFTYKSYTKASKVYDYNFQNHFVNVLDSEYPLVCNYIGYVKINNVTIHSSNAIISVNDALITELFDNDSSKSKDNDLLRYLFSKSRPNLEEAIIVSTSGQWGYYHFLMDFVPRLLLIQPKIKSSDKILVSNNLTVFQNEFFELANIEDKLILLEKRDKIKISKIISPLFTSQIGNPTYYTIKLIRDFFLNKLCDLTYDCQPNNIYISRSRAKTRRIINEVELEKTLKNYQIRTIHLEDLGLMEQCGLFANIDFVIAPHGAGLANLVFAKKGTRVIELFSKNHLEACFYRLSTMNELNYSFIVHDSYNQQNDMEVDLKMIEKTLDNLFQKNILD